MVTITEAPNNRLPRIAEMAHDIWNAYYSEFLPSDQISYMLEKFYSLPSLESQVRDGQRFFIISEEGEELGFVAFSLKGGSDYFINKFYIYPSQQRKRNGSRVMRKLEEIFCAGSDKAEIQIRLTVNRQNFKAVNFYFMNGFRIEKVEDFDIGNGYFMNDFVMLKTLICPQSLPSEGQ